MAAKSYRLSRVLFGSPMANPNSSSPKSRDTLGVEEEGMFGNKVREHVKKVHKVLFALMAFDVQLLNERGSLFTLRQGDEWSVRTWIV